MNPLPDGNSCRVQQFGGLTSGVTTMDGLPGRPVVDLDIAAVARFTDGLADGVHAWEAEEAALREIKALWPGVGKELQATMAFHGRAAEWAVTAGSAGGWKRDPARSVIFCVSGYPPSWAGAALPHIGAAAAAPAVRFAYATGDWTLSLLWEGALEDEPRCEALEARADVPARVLHMARAAGMEPPYCVQLPLALHWWGRDAAEGILAGYAAGLKELGPGSSLVLSASVPGGVAYGGRIAELTGIATGTVPHAWTPQDIEAVITATGMRLHERGLRDVREHDGNGWHLDELSSHRPGRFVGAVALVG